MRNEIFQTSWKCWWHFDECSYLSMKQITWNPDWWKIQLNGHFVAIDILAHILCAVQIEVIQQKLYITKYYCISSFV